jgi:uncharacterized protein (TIGR01777 family)
MKVVIPGGTGQVGTILARHFHREGHEVVVLSRGSKKASWRIVHWDGQTLGQWVKELEGADVLINLAGRVVNCRYNHRNRCEIWSSRCRSVRILGKALATLNAPPRVWLQAGTATIYAHRLDAPNDEYTGIIGGTEDASPDKWRFSIDVARAWEGEFALIETPKTRKVILRSAMTMSPDRDGIFDYLLWLVRVGLGGRAGQGNQYVSWIHYHDFINAIQFLIDRDDVSGSVNIASPNPLPNNEFMSQLRMAWKQKLALPIYEWMLELGALFLQTESELILKSRRVVPARLLDAGFSFEYPNWSSASEDLCSRWKNASRRSEYPKVC